MYSWITNSRIVINQCGLLITCSLRQNKIGDSGAQALAESLQHCSNLQKLA